MPWILGGALLAALACLGIVSVLLYRALIKLDNYSGVVGDISADILKFNRFVEEVNEQQLFFDTPKLRAMFATWRFLEHTIISSCESLEIVIDGGHITSNMGEDDGQA